MPARVCENNGNQLPLNDNRRQGSNRLFWGCFTRATEVAVAVSTVVSTVDWGRETGALEP